MAAGHPLTDEDRWPWLDTIAAWIDERVAAGEPAVVTCSALKKIYRDKLRRQGSCARCLAQMWSARRRARSQCVDCMVSPSRDMSR